MAKKKFEYKGIADLTVDIHSNLLSVREKFGEAVELFRQLNDFVPLMNAEFGKNPPQIKFDLELKAMAAAVPLEHAEFAAEYAHTVVKEKDNVKKMFILASLMKRLANVSQGLQRKERKLVERRKNGAGSVGEGENVDVLLAKVRANLAAANNKYRFCVEKFLMLRKAIIARLFGITETAFREARSMGMHISSLQLQKHAIEKLCDELVALDCKAPRCEN